MYVDIYIYMCVYAHIDTLTHTYLDLEEKGQWNDQYRAQQNIIFDNVGELTSHVSHK